jgi:hypothetical protein
MITQTTRLIRNSYKTLAMLLITLVYHTYINLRLIRNSYKTHAMLLITLVYHTYINLRLSLPPVICRRAHVLFTLFVFVCA